METEAAFSDSSEKLLQEVEEGQYLCDFSEGRVHTIKHAFFLKVSVNLIRVTANHRLRCHQQRNLVLSNMREMQSWSG